MKLWWLLLTSIPDIIKLLQQIEKSAKDYNTDRKVKDDLKTLHEAFAEKDAAKVTALFSGEPIPPAPVQPSS